MYDQTIPRLDHALKALSGILTKAEAHCETHKIDPLALTTFRLFPDMLPFTRQVLIACDFAKGCGARLAGIDNPSFADTEVTFADLKARIEKTRAFLATIKPAQLDGAETRRVSIKLGGQEMEFSGADYYAGVVVPNVLFHITTAYNILRHNGVALGKADFMGR
jgi:hypothetical protein